MNGKNNKNSIMGKICAPAMLYLVLSVIRLVWLIFAKFSASVVLLKGIFVALWTWLLCYLCWNGYEVVSWVLVILPIVFVIVMMVMAFETIKGVVKKDIKREMSKELRREHFEANEDDENTENVENVENVENFSDNQDDEKEYDNVAPIEHFIIPVAKKKK
jgi:uncharacterized membrane protein